MSIKWVLFVVCATSFLRSVASAGDVVSPLPGRFTKADASETPDFRRHVLPTMGRMGCNSRACHGSFQGQGGFHLSLFGYDFKSDYDALTAGQHPRIDLAHPENSLILNKPTSADNHGGGLRFPEGSWQYNVFRRWIETGAKGVSPGDAEFVRLTIAPAEVKFDHVGATAKLRIVASWSDGATEDVTAISRFRSNDDSVATIDEDGVITSRGPGDSHVVAFYDNGVQPIPVMLPMSDRVGSRYPDVAAPTLYDRLVIDKLRKLGVVPASTSTDAEFLRRVSLDLTGTLPGPKDIESFLADKSPDKRARKIDQLLETPAYAAWWTTKLCDLTGNNPQQQSDQIYKREQSRQWYEWIYRRVLENKAYDEIIAGLLLANGRDKPDQSYLDYCREMGSYFRQSKPADFTARKTMPYYLSRTNVRKPEEKALSVSYAMLGVRLECAQCHKHPFDQWTQKDFTQFQAFFQPVDVGVKPPSGPEAKQLREEVGIDKLGGKNRKQVIATIHERLEKNQPVPFTELYVNNRQIPPFQRQRMEQMLKNNPKFAAQLQKKGKAGTPPTVTPKLLGAEEVPLADAPDPRVKLMEWLRRKDNPYFARAWVNRTWAAYFGVGIVEPPDDMSQANPPSNRPLLDALAEGFVAHHYDMKWLHRTILNTAAYQRSWRTNASNQLDNHNFSHALVRRLPAEVVNDVLMQATANRQQAEAMQTSMENRAIGPALDKGDRYLLVAFGKPDRVVTCDCSRSNEPSLVQTVFLLNDAALRGRIDAGGWMQQVRQQIQPGKGRPVSPAASDALIREVFLRTVSRPPQEDEMKEAKNVVATAAGPVDGIRTLLWTMLNTKEFIVNH